MSVMRPLIIFLAMAVCGMAPLGVTAKEKVKEAKVSELMKGVNEVMSEAEAAYVNDEAKKAIELYRKALAEITKIEQENPKRVSTSEFAPVRFKKALCETEIDRIMLEEVNTTARTVAVTDTTALEAKRAERKKAAETNNVPEASVKLAAKQGSESAGDAAKPAEPLEKDEPAAEADKPVNVKEEIEFAKDMLSVDRYDEVEKSLVKVLKSVPENRDARFLMALARVQQGKFSEAAVVIDDLLEDNPKDESVLLLAAGAFAATGSYSKAMESLDKAMQANPKRPEGYHNMAWLLLEMNPKKTDESEMYYRRAVKLGGVRDRDLERRLGIKTE